MRVVKAVCFFLVALLLLLAGAQIVQAQTLDQYGGDTSMPVPGGATGYFRVAKLGNRWVFATPEGNAFWMLGVFGVTPGGSIDDLGDSHANRVIRKYGTINKWAEQSAKRLKGWGFNTLAEYASSYVLPVVSPSGNPGNVEKMPFTRIARPSYYGLTNTGGYAPAPFKELLAGIDPATYKGWGNGTPDVFDPNFQLYMDGLLNSDAIPQSPWWIGLSIDDADNIVGFGPGPDIAAPRIHPHIGWLVLVTNFQQTTNPTLGVTYTDPKVYSKLALRDFLRTKYGTIASLNTAWGPRYTNWDSAGGWPQGTGFLDESGRSPWVGTDADRLTGATTQVRADLDAFLYEYAKRYFTVLTGSVRRRYPHMLVFGPATLNGWGGLTRGPILRAAGETVDVLQAMISGPAALDLTVKYAGDRPITTWTGQLANPDSALWRYSAEHTFATQVERGQSYTTSVLRDFNSTTAAGIKPIVGTKFWEFVDNWGQKANFGLVSFLDNAYDGKEAVTAPGKDQWGFPTGGEERNYGDFVTAVTAVNAKIGSTLRAGSSSAVAGLAGGQEGQVPRLADTSPAPTGASSAGASSAGASSAGASSAGASSAGASSATASSTGASSATDRPSPAAPDGSAPRGFDRAPGQPSLGRDAAVPGAGRQVGKQEFSQGQQDTVAPIGQSFGERRHDQSSSAGEREIQRILDHEVRGQIGRGTINRAMSVTITLPTSGSTVQQSVTVSATASGASRVALLLDGTVAAIVGGTTARYRWDTTTASNGTHHWVAKASYASGNSVTSDATVVTVRNQPILPRVAIVDPTDNGSVSRNSTVTIVATASDNAKVTSVRFYQNSRLICTERVAPYRCAWKVPGTAEKTHKLQAKVYDAKGNVASSPIVAVKVTEGHLAGSRVPAERLSRSLAD